MHATVTVVFVIAVAVAGGVQLVIATEPWWHAVILAPSVAGAVWVASRWDRRPAPATLGVLLVLGEATWAAAVLIGAGPLSVLGLAAAGAVVISTQRTRRTMTAAALLGVVVVTALLGLLARPEDVASNALIAGGYTAMFIAVFWINDVSWRLFAELDATRRAETELAVLRERVRFAGDLHDIQGHTLHVIKLKAAVAARLQHTDPERVTAELADIERLTAETINQAQDLANSTRHLAFTSELTNATELFQAAGIHVTIDHVDSDLLADERLFALVLREATTNILRHTAANHVSIKLTAETLAITNDGAREPATRLRGLGTLRARVHDADGELDIEPTGDEFTLQLRLRGRAA